MLDLIDHNDHFIVINKHAGVSVHKDENNTSFFETIKNKLSLNDLFLVHRLDKITSGVMLLAKDGNTAKKLSELFAMKQIKKTYVAISDKKPKKKQGLVKGDMAKSRNGSWKLERSIENPAITRFESKALEGGHRLFILKPETGKTHQLRVMMKSLGSPILGDTPYGGTKADRTYLHCQSLEFTLNAEHFCFYVNSGF